MLGYYLHKPGRDNPGGPSPFARPSGDHKLVVQSPEARSSINIESQGSPNIQWANFLTDLQKKGGQYYLPLKRKYMVL